MNRYEYRFQRIKRKLRRRRNGKQKLNTILMLSVAAAFLLVLILSVVKIYSTVQNNKSQSAQTKTPDAATSASVAAVVQQAPTETPAPTTTPRPKAVALTFDDGPSRDNTGDILNVLQQYGAHATFFVLGDRARVDGDILQMELAAGCEIGSHSWNHPLLSKIKWNRVERQLKKTDNIVSKLTGGYQISLLRPPYGAISDKMRKKLDKPMILWSLDTLDWKTRNAGKIFKKVKREVKDGDIILMHDIHKETADAIEKVVPWLQNEGYDILTVSELMERNGKTIEAGKAYCDGKN